MRQDLCRLGGGGPSLGGASSAWLGVRDSCFNLPLKVHATIAGNVLDHPSIRPYLRRSISIGTRSWSRRRSKRQCFMNYHRSLGPIRRQSYLSCL